MLLSRHTRRREFITLLGGAAVVADCGPRIAFLGGGGRKKGKRALLVMSPKR
jgi:hypothetical protein